MVLMRTKIALLAAAAITAATAVVAPPAWAAAPGNDTLSGARLIRSVPYSTSEDTTQATSGRVDARLNTNCGAPATEASVWFKYTPADTDGILVDVTRSSYDAGIMVASGTPTNLTYVDCGPNAIAADTTPGTTLYVLVFDFVVGEGNGGTLRMSVSSIPPAPALTIGIDPIGHFTRRGTVQITGTVTCSGADTLGLGVDLTQPVGRFAISGSGYVELPCLASQTWSLTVSPFNGRFTGGGAAAVGYVSACGEMLCTDVDGEQAVKLRR
jgi:hypothetical protein